MICFGSRDPAQTADSLLATARKVVHKEAIRVALVAEGNKLAADQKKLRRYAFPCRSLAFLKTKGRGT